MVSGIEPGGYLYVFSGQVSVIYPDGRPDPQKIDRAMLRELIEKGETKPLVGFVVSVGENRLAKIVRIAKGKEMVTVYFNELYRAL